MKITIMNRQCILFLITVLLAASFPWTARNAGAAVYYVRTDGGTCAQCNGLWDAPYDPGSGSADCAWSHPFNALEGGEPPSWKIQGGDTLLIYPGSYQMGYGAPNTDWCTEDYPWDCHLPPLPSGPDADHPTRILGAGWDQGCPEAPELWGTERAYHIINLEGTSHAEVRCLEITDHSGCIEFHEDEQVRCKRDDYPYGEWAFSGILASDSSSVLLKDLNLHGFASHGIQAGGLTDWTVEDVRIAGNGWAGWEGDIPGDEDSNSGKMTFNRFTVEWNGCGETYPDESIHGCWAQSAGGYGDGFGTARTGGHWMINDSIFRYNTSDGLDLLYVREAGTQIDIKRSQAYGNAGDQFKTNGPAAFENCLAVSECGFFEGKSFTYNVGNCRSGGTAVVLTMRQGNQVSLVHSTVAGEGGVLVLVECEGASCDDGNVIIMNNIFMEYTEFLDPSDLSSYLWYEPEVFGSRQIGYNLVYHSEDELKTGNIPLSDHDINEDPLLMDAGLETFDYRLQKDSPAIDAGLSRGSLNGLLPDHDINGTSRPVGSGPDMGCHEFTETDVSGPPIPDIKANGSDGPVTVSYSDAPVITISLDAGNQEGLNADWWIASYSSSGWHSLVAGLDGLTWQPGIKRCIELPIEGISSLTVPSPPFSMGVNSMFFVIDDNADGSPDITWWDVVEVTLY